MGVWSASALVAASMIGAGVYTTSGFTLADLGSPFWVMVAWAIGGVIAICGALCYAALAEKFTESGGEYLFLARAVHPAAGMMAGWVSLLAGFTGAIAFAATTFESYAREGMPMLNGLFPGVVASTAVIFAAVVHSFGLRSGTRLQDAVVAIKLSLIGLFLLLALTTIGSWEGGGAQPNSTEPIDKTPWQFALTFANALTWISLSYSGFNAAVYLASEVKDPSRSVPRSMVFATVGVTALYLFMNAVFVYAPSASAIAGQPTVATIAAEEIGGRPPLVGTLGPSLVERLVRLAILCGLASSVSALMQTGPRVVGKMADDGFLPKWLADPARADAGVPNVPTRAIWVQSVLAVIVILFSSLRQQLDYLGFTLSVCAGLCGSLVFFLRGRQVRVQGFPIVPLIYVGGTMVIATLTAIRAPIQAGIGLATLLIGIIAYALGADRSPRDA